MKRRLEDLFADYSAPGNTDAPSLALKATHLARFLQKRATELQTPQEKRQQAELERMMQTPADKATVTQITDQAFRSESPSRAVDQLTHILDLQGVPRFFSPVDRAMLRGFQSFGSYLPGVAVPLVKDKMREETANVILPAEPELLQSHLAARRREGVRMNVNHLGEALLGEAEAEERMRTYLHALQMPEIEVISVKISTIYSQISLLAREHTLEKLGERLELLYRAALKGTYKRNDGTVVPKFVYLDMEEYRDLEVTAEAFMQTLDRSGLQKSGAGIALQAYLPDSFRIQRRITEWAKKRVAAGGAPVTIRVVKGANMEMERVESSIHGWEQPPYQQKIDTDANYKRMLQYGMEPDNVAAVRLGVASHNLFDLSYGLLLAADRGCLDNIQFEMLEGMANHQRRALFEFAQNMLLYAPATPKSGFLHAIGYLIRRLDENTGPENFLRHAFKIEVGSEEWQRLEKGFLDSFERIESLPDAPRRTQNRQQLPENSPLPTDAPFDNEADTDWSLPHNVDWGQAIIAAWRDQCGDNAAELPLEIAGDSIANSADRDLGTTEDPSRPGTVVARFPIATAADVDAAVACAKADPDGWGSRPHAERAGILANTAHELRLARAELLGAALAEGGKLLTESDPEVSEAIDFVEYYPRTVAELAHQPDLECAPIGPVAVIPPWNFPLAIPCGGIAAALAAGNTVIMKPAMQTVLCAYKICECFWRAGVPKTALQFVAGPGNPTGAALAGHPDLAAVILTGGTETALKILDQRPETNLLAETGGKNATIVTALSDRELAIKHVVQSTFGHSGQKCSATSLLILEDEVYKDPDFRRALCDAVKSLPVGSAWDPHTKVGPLIRPPRGPLETALKELEPGEEWAVVPHNLDHNPKLWSPAVKWGVTPGSFTHTTEFFGPVLGVMRAANLETAIDLVNQTGYGLTSGLESLDDREQALWRDGVRAGNLYLNRGTTGAIVLRQPFGGMGKSAFGPGIKAGGPNYVAQLLTFTHTPKPDADQRPITDPQINDFLAALKGCDQFSTDTVDRLQRFAADAEIWMDHVFSKEHDFFHLVGQDNVRRYLPAGAVRIRVTADDQPADVAIRILAAYFTRCQIAVSFAPGAHKALHQQLETITVEWGAIIEFVEESDVDLAAAISRHQTDRVRYAAPDRVPAEILATVGDTGVYVARNPVVTHPRIELLWYLREQSISFDYHRCGNLGTRADEKRRPVP